MGKATMGQEKEEDVEYEEMPCNDHYIESNVMRKTYIPKLRSHKSIGPDPKSVNQEIRIKTSGDSQTKGPVPPTQALMNVVNLSKLETKALRRYCRFFNIVDIGPNSSQEHLLDAVQNHFMSQLVDEADVIVEFAHAAKRLKTEHDCSSKLS